MRFMFGTIDLTSRITLAFAAASKDSRRRVKMVFSFGFCVGRRASEMVTHIRGERKDGVPLRLAPLLQLVLLLPPLSERQMLLA